MHRPHFDYEVAARISQDEDDDEDVMDEKYQKEFNENVKKGHILQPAKDHPDWKWIIQWEAFKTVVDYKRRSNYCNPDCFGMYIYNDFCGFGLQELMENIVFFS